jgi:hypothetical protein
MKIFPILLLFALLMGCTDSKEVKTRTVIIEERYSLELPTFLREAKDLHEDASLQYQNRIKDYYVIVIDEPKQDLENVLEEEDLTEEYTSDLKGYTKLLLDGFGMSLQNMGKSELIYTVINDLPANLVKLTGRVDGVDVFFYVGFFEGKETYYQVLAWTSEKKASLYKANMLEILKSMKEI